ncbi:PI31 proteasome regulator N-terminal-domain-containing protein [Dichotomocladium elegans]|nr:PI31 proteasome regulator N-terminal-domain-containing protein [Dichotomocladium elegans]
MSKNVLDPASLLHTIAQIAPQGLQNPQDALAAAAHAIMLSIGAKFAGLGDDARQSKLLPEGWNSQGPSHYAFRYSHPQSSMTFVIKSIRLGDRWLCLGLGIEDNKTATLDIVTSHFTSAAFFPYNPSDERSDPLVHGYISTSQFQEFVSLFKINILHRILPGLQKPGYEDTRNDSNSSAASQVPRAHPPPLRPGQQDRSPPIRPPIFDDPLSADDTRMNVGRSDLEPMGGGLRMPGQGGGMFVGPNHPMFIGRGEGVRDPFGGRGGPGELPPGAVPPGARFDPIGPTGMRPPRGPRGGFFSGEPDNDDAPPPVSKWENRLCMGGLTDN